MNDTPYTSRQRVLDALNHREPDRVPFDVGSSIETGITIPAYENFIDLLGLKEEEDDTLFNFFLTTGGFKQVPENVLEYLKVDTRGAHVHLPTEPETRIEFEGTTMIAYDEWGIKWARPESSHYMDPVDFPLKGELTKERIDNFPWPDGRQEGRFVGLKEETQRMRDTGCAVVMSLYGLGIFGTARLLCGMESTLIDMALKPDLIGAVFHKVKEYQMQMWEKVLEIAGENIDICLNIDDLGMQEGPLISPQMYRDLIKPCHEEMFNFIRKNAQTDVKIALHSCGSVRKLIPDFIEIGVDALNPIQVSTAGMDSKELKKEFGKDISFWGGGVDTQYVLPIGSVSEVKDEVKRRIDDLAPGGGFLFTPVHTIQPDVPPENLRAMWEAFQEHCEY